MFLGGAVGSCFVNFDRTSACECCEDEPWRVVVSLRNIFFFPPIRFISLFFVGYLRGFLLPSFLLLLPVHAFIWFSPKICLK